jgi:hypothetical protein
MLLFCDAAERIPITGKKEYHNHDLMEYWYKLPYVTLEQAVQEGAAIDIPRRVDPGHSRDISALQRAQLNAEVRRVFRLLAARNYSAFTKVLHEYFPGEITLSSEGDRSLRGRLKIFDHLQDVQALKSNEVLENYWTFKTRLGQSSEYFVGYVPGETYCLLSTIEGVPLPTFKTLSPFFPEDVKELGQKMEESSFDFSAGDPAKVAQKEGLLVADVRILLHTSQPDVAYPFAVRYWWSESRGIWVPWFASTYCVIVPRPVEVVF